MMIMMKFAINIHWVEAYERYLSFYMNIFMHTAFIAL
jgi:hypothetical protein